MKNKIEEIIFDLFRKAKCRENHIIMMRSINLTYHNLNPKEQDLFYGVINELIKDGYFIYEDASSGPECLRLTKKGYEKIYEDSNLENDFDTNKINSVVQNTINNTFYGGQNHTNNAAGTNISINSNSKFVLNKEQKKFLAEIGVESNEVEELNDIVSTNNDSKTFSEKLLGWFGSVSSSMVARGAYDNIPKLHEFVNQFI